MRMKLFSPTTLDFCDINFQKDINAGCDVQDCCQTWQKGINFFSTRPTWTLTSLLHGLIQVESGLAFI